MDAQPQIDLLVVPNYSVAVTEGGVHANRNEVEFLREVCERAGKVVIATFARGHPNPTEVKASVDSSGGIYSLGAWSECITRIEKIKRYASAAYRLSKLTGRSYVSYIFLPGWSGLIAAALCVIGGRRFGVYIRGALTHHGRVSRLIVLALSRRASFVVCTGHGVQRSLRTVGIEASLVSPMVSFREASDLTLRGYSSNATTNLLFVGDLSARKGLDEFLQVIVRLRAREVAVCARLIGEVSVNEADWLIETISCGGLEGIVRVCKYESSSAGLRQHFEWADMLVFPSIREGFPRVIYEAMLSGVVVVAYDAEYGVGFLRDNDNCALAIERDVCDLSSTIEALAGDAELRRRLSIRAQKDVLDFLAMFRGRSHAQQVADLVGMAQES